MVERIMKYNPAFLSEDKLVEDFVVRLEELDLVMGVIRENTSDSNQHVLILGSRGSGKTTLALRAVAEVGRNEELCELWYPIVFGEESYMIKTAGEFWLEALFHLKRQTKDEGLRKAYEELREERDEDRLRERVLGQLMDFADSVGRRLLLVVENLNMVLDEQMSDNEGWKLRETLLHEGRVMLLATATRRFEAIENCGKPMFELFRPFGLEPLDEDACRTLWESVTGVKLLDDRIRPIQILTGGSPRLLTIISQFGAGMSFKELMGDLMRLVDEHTEYFKSHLDALPAVERSVYLALAELWDPSTAREVAEAAREEVTNTSSLLGRLEKRGAVVVVDKKGRTKWYQVAERMYNIYYLMRRRGGASRRVRAVVNFMVHFYGPDELAEITKRIAEEACKLGKTEADEHCVAFKEILLQISVDKGISVIQNIPIEFIEMLNMEGLVENKKILSLTEGFKCAFEKKNMEGAEEKCNELLSFLPENGNLWATLGLFRWARESYEEALEAFEKAIKFEPESVLALSMRGYLLHVCFERTEEGKKAIEKSLELGEVPPLVARKYGEILFSVGEYEKAEQVCRSNLEREPEESSVWMFLGASLEKQERLEEAIEAYRTVLRFTPNFGHGWLILGSALFKLEQYGDSEKACRRAVELEPEYADGWIILGHVLDQGLQDYEGAKKAFKKSIDLDSENVMSWLLLGQLLHKKLKEYESAAEHYQKGLDLEPENTFVLRRLCEIFLEIKRKDEAMEIFQKILADVDFCENFPDTASELMISFAAVNLGQKVLDVLEVAESVKFVEPLVVGLKLYLGEEVKVAAEIMEVGKDVVKRIEKRKAELEGGVRD